MSRPPTSAPTPATPTKTLWPAPSSPSTSASPASPPHPSPFSPGDLRRLGPASQGRRERDEGSALMCVTRRRATEDTARRPHAASDLAVVAPPGSAVRVALTAVEDAAAAADAGAAVFVDGEAVAAVRGDGAEHLVARRLEDGA